MQDDASQGVADISTVNGDMKGAHLPERQAVLYGVAVEHPEPGTPTCSTDLGAARTPITIPRHVGTYRMAQAKPQQIESVIYMGLVWR
jgi:hypothetical protein